MKKRSFLYRAVTCLVAGFVTAALWLLIGGGVDHLLFPKLLIFSLVALSLAGVIIVPLIWQYLTKKNSLISDKIYGWLYAIIRYAIAIDLSIFGWKKLFHLQFIVSDKLASLPMNQQSGEMLTWFYFGHSYIFGCIVAGLQLLGAAMLLFRKTWLSGAFILFALLLNIASIDIFYQMNPGALAQAVIMCIGTLFLILIDFNRIVAFFFNADTDMRSVNARMSIKNLVRMVAILFAFFLTWYSATH